jgi:hypothetical protein
VKAAFTHGSKYRHERRTAPWAERLIRGVARPNLAAVAARRATAARAAGRRRLKALPGSG